jgi:acyl CoA:acetate/3-ketoacid CoA transferase beta subunit
VADATRAEVCAVACAEAWRGDGAVLASAFGLVPTIGARLAKATFEPDLLVSDGEAYLVANALPLGSEEKIVEGWIPFRSVFDLVAAGKRHVMMGASQLDRHGNQNISCIGDHARPKVQLIGVRGSPGNTVNHPTSYWVPSHSPRVFVEDVDMVSGVGYRRAAEAGPEATRHHEIRRVITDKGVFDFETPDHSMRLRSVHPGVSVDDAVDATGFPLSIPGDVPETRAPSDEELRLIREVLDPRGLRDGEVKA